MNPTEFIRNNITDKLVSNGFSLSVAQSAANEGVKYYLKATGATVRGGLFNDCFKHAEAWAKKLSKIDKPLKQKRTQAVAPAQAFTLF